MHKEILSDGQLIVLNLLREFRREFYLAGGTAIALHIGHRRSIDFDLFKLSVINHKKIISKITASGFPYKVIMKTDDQLNVIVGDVKLTFLEYPFKIEARKQLDSVIRLPSLLDLTAMKAYALGRRSKWKDYLDLYFILRDHYSVEEISERAGTLFEQLFSEKLFRSQLAWFSDIDYSEEAELLTDTPVSKEEVMAFLTEKAIRSVL
jgi:hypothetical protein